MAIIRDGISEGVEGNGLCRLRPGAYHARSGTIYARSAVEAGESTEIVIEGAVLFNNEDQMLNRTQGMDVTRWYEDA